MVFDSAKGDGEAKAAAGDGPSDLVSAASPAANAFEVDGEEAKLAAEECNGPVVAPVVGGVATGGFASESMSWRIWIISWSVFMDVNSLTI